MDDLIAKLRAVKVRTPEEVMARREFRSGNYVIMPKVEHYALALKALRGACAADKNSIQPEDFGLVRSLTFEETIKARVEDYNRLTNPDGSGAELEDRLHLFKAWFDTSTAVVYKAGTTKFKIVPLSEHLVTLEEHFKGLTPSVSYDDFSDYEELDSAVSSVVYNKLLSRDEILEHPAWRACVQDKELLREYRDIVFGVCRDPEGAMDFCVLGVQEEDRLLQLFVDNGSGAGAQYNLNSSIAFLRVVRGDVND